MKWVLSFFEKLYGRARASELSEPLRLNEVMSSRIGSLSKGELKRTLLALGLLTPHPLLLLDEPFDGLDLRQTRDVMTLLRNHAATGRTLMLSIHQLVDAGRVCDRLVLLSGGRVVGDSVHGTSLQASLNGKHLLDYTLAAPVSGRVGVWSKTDSVSYFDDYMVTK